ncbi:hypothetical protein Q5H93_00675 [Hymenobacter sp. ASUV-10]|uniref:Uncharacterized protein n=1 Tax=Hymenobacter aranciens TaxID=3063996 RepID=A0ABT9B508_9BACT|nr:hypothetical protein [Hymenobacter sp. ASUV-10]MDO7873227.1 hypothetical protein [Hymenobacter sp. ASUV-10]
MSSENDYHRRKAAEEQRLAQLVRDTEHELRTNPDYQPYFAGYDPASVEGFIRAYAQRKVHYLQSGPTMVRWTTHQASEFREEAYERLWEIQQKKLFDLQCQWRAGRLRLPGVDLCEQFHDFGEHPERCAWLPPITPDEVAAYRDYLLSDECVDVGYDHRLRSYEWQNYENTCFEGLKEATGYGRQPYHPWYRYYDARFGPGPQLGLPDVRGPRQEFYLNLGDKEETPAAEGPAPRPDPVYDRRPHYGPYAELEDAYTAFMERFETIPELMEKRRAFENVTHYGVDDELIMAMDLLTQVPELLPVPEDAPEWRPVILQLAAQVRKQLLAEALPLVYDDYRLRLDMGLRPAPPYRSYRDDDDDDISPRRKEWQDKDREKILRGRERNGEPRDFNY